METQCELIPAELLPDGWAIPGAEAGESTGERIRKHRPELFEATVALLAEGYSMRGTARATKLALGSVRAIARMPEARTAVDAHKERIANNCEDFAVVASERMLEEVDNYSPMQLAIAMGIAAEKSLLMRGQATSIVERRDGARVTSLDELLANMRNVSPAQTGCAGGTAEQKAAPVLGAVDRAASEASVDDASTGVAS